MKKAVYNILPETEDILKTMGEQIKLARLRRDLPVELVAERAGISRSSLWKVESGSPAVAIGIYAAVLHTFFFLNKGVLVWIYPTGATVLLLIKRICLLSP